MIRVVSFVLVICALAVSASTSVAQASDPPRFEVGGQFSLLNFDVFDNFGDRRRNEFGGGARVAIGAA